MEENCSRLKKNSDEIELHSEKDRHLLGEIPSSLVTWGVVIVIALILAFVIVICFVPFPYFRWMSTGK